MKQCKICKKESDSLEIHHIVPKSRGGTDDKSNLINICVDCHGKVHNVSFKGKSGIISEALSKKQKAYDNARLWFQDEENIELAHDKLMELYYEDENKHELMLTLIECNIITCDRIMNWCINGRLEFIKKFTF